MFVDGMAIGQDSGVAVEGVYNESRGDVMGHVQLCLIDAWNM